MTSRSSRLSRQLQTSESPDGKSAFSSPAMNAALFCVLLGAIDLTVIAAVLPGMIADLRVNTSDIDRYIWIVSGYLIAYIVAIPLIGRVSDFAGRRFAFLLAIAVFLVGSIVCALANSLDSLIVGRCIQGFGGGGLLPVAIALTGDTLPRRRRLAGIALVSAVDTLGWVIGPVYGALIDSFAPGATEHWRWIFWINIPLLLVAAALVARAFPAPEPGESLRALRRLDLPGAVFLTGLLVAVNLALSTGGELGSQTGSGLRALGGTTNPLARYVWLFVVLAVVCVLLLAVTQRRSASPILPVTLLRNRTFLFAGISNFVLGVVLMVGMVDVPVVVTLLHTSGSSSSSNVSAAILASYTICIMATSLASARLIRRFGLMIVMLGGLVCAGGGLALLYPLLEGDHVWRMIPGLVVAGCGLGTLIAPLSSAALDEANEEERGAAASTSLVFRLLGMTIGISALSSIAVKRLQVLTDRLPPVSQQPNESTAAFLLRQQQFLQDRVIPLAVQVIQETFLIAAALTLLALIPVIRIARTNRSKP
ncbi:MAG TPA: MFS transporter [Thermomicrobiales bacterium]|nr:MFS transporter [Thermomicrobiales bacterium]